MKSRTKRPFGRDCFSCHHDYRQRPHPQEVPVEQAEAPSPEAKLAELEARLAEMSDAYLRAKAEVENIRRRSEDEMAKARKFAVEGFAEAMLPVMDSMEAAIAMPEAKVETVLEGVHATRRQLAAALERNKVIEINPAPGSKFDPHQHQAISMVPAEQEANTVVMVLQKGYSIAERVLRPALITVAAPK
ncbi:nucleotide exchange factor GrpE [Paucibacter sp. O1-1]|nr:nucleotide exchange factor GrpE [Paucibacter sp. M5-1]MCU7371429.1 nucleotide exchange factor GrpE [Paucibacter sp. O1-1]MCZ7883291.1 nucleotide exchange factor GrpE [Paucibacter sp. M5-1]MDA3826418.1 nucleotide exchange factor GrpE [Paucibacter sp. O1-1]